MSSWKEKIEDMTGLCQEVYETNESEQGIESNASKDAVSNSPVKGEYPEEEEAKRYFECDHRNKVARVAPNLVLLDVSLFRLCCEMLY